MKINELNPKLKEQEAKELEKKYREFQQKKERWAKFKETIYYKLVLELLEEELEDARSIKALPTTVTPKDFEELGKITAVQLQVYARLEKIKQKLINE